MSLSVQLYSAIRFFFLFNTWISIYDNEIFNFCSISQLQGNVCFGVHFHTKLQYYITISQFDREIKCSNMEYFVDFMAATVRLVFAQLSKYISIFLSQVKMNLSSSIRSTKYLNIGLCSYIFFFFFCDSVCSEMPNTFRSSFKYVLCTKIGLDSKWCVRVLWWMHSVHLTQFLCY